MYYLIYRVPRHRFPEPGFTQPIGGLVVPVEEGGLVEDVACQRYHIAPYEWLFSVEVTDWSAKKRRQAWRLHVQWELEMNAWLEMVG